MMEKNTFFYCGDNLFKKLRNLIDLNNGNLPKYTKFKLFHSAKVAATDIAIDEVFLGWSYIVYCIGKKFYHVGFFNSRDGTIEVFKDLNKEISISSCATKVCAFSEDGSIFYYSTKNVDDLLSFSSKADKKIQDLKCGEHYSVVLYDDGSVNLLNLNEKITLTELYVQQSIIQVACGKEHVLFLSECGQVLSFGNGSRGQLGHGSIDNHEKPLLLEALDGIIIKSISCGGWHSAVISESGDLYIWGWNEKGQLGFPCSELHSDTLPLSEIETVCCLPKLVDLEEDKLIESVSCGTRHTVILTGDNEVWSWGWNEYGQLGHGEYPLCDKPCRIPLPKGFVPKSINCAFWSTLILGSLSV